MIVTIHQPEHLPYFGFLDKANKSDIFVMLDDVNFKKNNFQNRNKILTPNGIKWLGIPVEMKNLDDKYINARKVTSNWKEKYKNQIVEAYKKADYFKEGFWIIENMLNLDSEFLIDYNMFYIDNIFIQLNIKAKLVFSSSLNIETTKTQRIYDICKILNASSYLAGTGSIDYLNSDIFKSDVEILHNSFEHPKYNQIHSKDFIPLMSSLDFIMNIGVKGLREKLNGKK